MASYIINFVYLDTERQHEGLGKLATALENIKKDDFRRPGKSEKSCRLSQSHSMPLFGFFQFISIFFKPSRISFLNHLAFSI